ncbi:MAG: hypothetical protein ACQEQS_07040 [Thermodesulfobacteriota bacterium]
MAGTKTKKIWISFQKKVSGIFLLCLAGLVASDFLIHRHHHFKLGEIHLFEAFAGIIFIALLALLSFILKAVLFKP